MGKHAWSGQLFGAILLVLAFRGEVCAQQPQSPPVLTYGVTGSVSSQGLENPTNLLSRPLVQVLVLRAARGGVTAEQAGQLLQGGDVTLDHLVSAGLLSDAGAGRYFVAFNLITAEDRALLDRVIEPYARSLAGALISRRDRYERVLANYDLAGIRREELMFALIGCVGLDWDGLTVTAGVYRTQSPQRANGDQYSVWAREVGPSVGYRGLYWGSHTSERDGVWLTTFGDHDALPRSGLPDAAWEAGAAIGRARLEEPVRRSLRVIASRTLATNMDRAASVMLRLRAGPGSLEQIAGAAGGDEARDLMNLLVALDYVREQDGIFAATIPVFAEQDRGMIERVRAETRQVMTQWLRSNYSSMRHELAGMTVLGAGVTYEQLYTEIWHFLFGATNRILSEEGFFIDPYAADARWRGYAPFVWSASLQLNE